MSMLCTQCQALLAWSPPHRALHEPDPMIIHHPSMQSFHTSTLAGCHFCNLVASSIPGRDKEDPVAAIECSVTTTDSGSIFISFHCRPAGGRRSGLDGELSISDVATFHLLPAEMLINAAGLYTSTTTTLSEASLGIAKKWLDICLGSHGGHCDRASKQGQFFPTRVVDVGSTDDVTLRVHTEKLEAPYPPYVTLSHCWGKSQILTLTEKTYAQLTSGFDGDIMPKTFRDAVRVVRSLGLRYLWIDSLCILQDSKDDWRKEAAKMGDVYRSGVLNIAATAAPGGDVGMDFPRDAYQSRHLCVDVPEGGITAPPGRYYVTNANLWKEQVDGAVLNSRGWVLQERTLSPRRLHFARHQLMWECGYDLRCEMFSTGYQYPALSVGATAEGLGEDMRSFVQTLQCLRDTPRDDATVFNSFTLDDAYRGWDKLVRRYTAQNLTKGEDKLIAIQALAIAMEEATDDSYAAGLWNSRIAEDLLWAPAVATASGARYSRPAEWRAPSWSWASMDGGPVARATGRGRYAGRPWYVGKCLVEDAEVGLEGVDGVTTGQLTNADILIRGQLFVTTVTSVGIETAEVREESATFQGIVVDTHGLLARLFVIPDEWDWVIGRPSDYVVEPGGYFFPVGTYRGQGPVVSPPFVRVEGLVLKRDLDNEGCFRRVAFFAADGLEQQLRPGGEGCFFNRLDSSTESDAHDELGTVDANVNEFLLL